MDKKLKSRSLDALEQAAATISEAFRAECRGDWMAYPRLIARAQREIGRACEYEHDARTGKPAGITSTGQMAAK